MKRTDSEGGVQNEVGHTTSASRGHSPLWPEPLHSRAGNPASGVGSELPAVTVTGNSITIAWQCAAPGPHSFTIERQDAFTSGEYSEIGRVSADDSQDREICTWTDAGLPPGVTYNYRISETAASEPRAGLFVQATTLPVPHAPTLVSCEPRSGDSLSIRLVWTTESPGECGIRIERAPDLDDVARFGHVATVKPGVTAYSDTSIKANTAYSYRLFAKNSYGDSAPSEVATVMSTR